MKYGEKQMSETFLVGALLAVVGGFLDAYTYLQRGGVFANAQTGNIVLFGIKIAEGKVWESIFYLIPILSFFLGIVVSEHIKETSQNRFKLHWRQITIVFEILVLLSIVFMPYEGNMIANTLVAFACSLQVQSFRKINGNAYATTMCTGNLRSAAESLYVYKKTKNKEKLLVSLQYYGIIAFFIVGACLGTVLVRFFADDTILFACAMLALVFFLLFKKRA
jgi:uncharacterized membrane protein YoaK (UPF0700 family)